MTNRAEHPKPKIELATEDVLRMLNAFVTVAFDKYNLSPIFKPGEFRSILCGYFHGKSIEDWARDLSADLTESDILAAQNTRDSRESEKAGGI